MSMFYTAIITTVISAGVSAYGQHQQGEAAKDSAEYNNRLAQNEARNRELESMEQIKRQRESNRRQLADMRARLASNGTLTTEGTPLAILGESSARLELGIQDAARQSAMEASALRQKGLMGLWEGQQAATAGNLAAIGTGLKGLSSAASLYDQGVYQGAIPDTFNLYPRTRSAT